MGAQQGCRVQSLPAHLLYKWQLVQVEGRYAAILLRELHDLLCILLDVLAHIRHTQQLLN